MTDLATMWSSLQTQLQAHRPVTSTSDNSPRPTNTTTPVCLITGFLGSGKSTLLARLVVSPPDGLVIKAVVNDVGALPIDPTLIAAGDDLRIELMNGCGCCEQTAELAATLDALANDTGTDLVVLEASGVADPLALAHIVEANQRLHLDRIVAVVDAAAMALQLEDLLLSPIIGRQIEAAHSIVLTHGDLLGADELDAAVRRVIEQAPGRVVTTSTLAVPAIEALTPAALQGAHPWPTAAALNHQLVTLALRQTNGVARHALLEALSDARPELVRAKGRLKLDGALHLVQMTPTSIVIEPDPTPMSGRDCGLTLIATGHAATRELISLLGECDESAG